MIFLTKQLMTFFNKSLSPFRHFVTIVKQTMNSVKTVVDKSSAEATQVTATQKVVNPNKPLRPGHWKRWYFISEETRLLVLSKARWWFFLIYPAWVLSHLDNYKPNPDRIRRAFFESQLGTPMSPMEIMKQRVPGFIEATRPK